MNELAVSSAPEAPHPGPLPNREREERPRSWKRLAILTGVGLVWFIAIIAGGIAGLIDVFGPSPLGKNIELSTIVLDRSGKLLRPYVTSDGRWRLPATREDVDPRYLDMLLAYEDKRFFHHRGVDPLALTRAAFSAGEVRPYRVRRLDHHDAGGAADRARSPKRSFHVKLREMVRAMQLEWALEQGRDSRPLSHACALWRQSRRHQGRHHSPISARSRGGSRSARRRFSSRCRNRRKYSRPDRAPVAARRARDRVLDRVAGSGHFSPAEIDRAKQETVPHERHPHAAARAARRR